MIGYTFIKTSLLPFHEEVNALIKKYPEYLQGIKDGLVHIGWDPGHCPDPRRPRKRPVRAVVDE